MTLETIIAQGVARAEPYMFAFMLVLLRISIVLAIAPWPGRMVPNSIKASLAVSTALLLTFALPSTQVAHLTGRTVVPAIIAEVFYGGALAFGMWLAVSAITLTGQICGLQMGFGLRGALDPASGSNMNAVARIAFLALTRR